MSKHPVLKPPTVAAPKTPQTQTQAPVNLTTLFPKPTFTGEREESIIHPKVKGVKLITGFRGFGKTSYAVKIDNPANILMIDCEDKGELLVKPLGIGGYFQPMTEVMEALGASRFDIEGAYDRILQIVDAIPPDRFTTLIIDNAQDLQDGAAQFIRNNPAIAHRYGVRPENAMSGGYGGAWPGAKHVIANLLHLANSKGIQVIAITFQLKPAWKDGKPEFNKWKTTDLTIWHERSILTLVLVDPMPEHYPNRRALVMKESLSELRWVPGVDGKRGYTKQIKYLPAALPSATPYAVYDYLDNPADFKNPQPGETVTALELAPYTPTFSKEQLYLAERMARAQTALGIPTEGENE